MRDYAALAINVTKQQNQWLRDKAEEEDRSVSSLIRLILSDAMKMRSHDSVSQSRSKLTGV